MKPAFCKISPVNIDGRGSNRLMIVLKIKQIKEALGKEKILEFAIGLESSNDYLRNKIIKKGLSKKSYEKTVAKVKEAGVHLLTYLLIKPPHVSEKEAISDAVESAAYVFRTAANIGVSARAAFEPVFVCENTYLEKLYLQSRYRLLKEGDRRIIIQSTPPGSRLQAAHEIIHLAPSNVKRRLSKGLGYFLNRKVKEPDNANLALMVIRKLPIPEKLTFYMIIRRIKIFAPPLNFIFREGQLSVKWIYLSCAVLCSFM